MKTKLNRRQLNNGAPNEMERRESERRKSKLPGFCAKRATDKTGIPGQHKSGTSRVQ